MTPPASLASSPPRVLVLGARGHIGRACVEAFAGAGWSVTAQLRRPAAAPWPPGVREVVGDARELDAIAEAARGACIVVNALNPDYTRWATDWPPLAEAALALARRLDARLMLPGNVYIYGRQIPPVLREDTPPAADHPKARQRLALEHGLRDAARGERPVRSAVIRAGDFLGPRGVAGTWLDLGLARRLDRGIVTHLGPPQIEHAWAWLPDLARVFVAVAERDATLPPHIDLHYAGLSLTGEALHSALERWAGRPLRRAGFPWWMLKLVAPFAAMPRAVLEMRHLWERPHRLDETRLAQLIGTVPHTPLDEVLRQALGPGERLSA